MLRRADDLFTGYGSMSGGHETLARTPGSRSPGRAPTPTPGLVDYRSAGVIADVDDLLWIATVTLLRHLGADAPFAELAGARRRHKITSLREATSLLNGRRRHRLDDRFINSPPATSRVGDRGEE